MSIYAEISLLVGLGFIVGIINTMSGGGSMLTLPLLIFLGLDSSTANGTNRIGILLQNISAIGGFKSKGVQLPSISWPLAVSSLIGSGLGAMLALSIKDEMFNRILAIFMVVLVVYMVLKPNRPVDAADEKISGTALWYSVLAFFFIGIYGGFIQAGTGIFMLLALSSINRLSLVKSNLVKAVVMLVYTVATLGIFFYYGKLNFKYGLLLAAGQFAGGWLSARWSVSKGDSLVKVFLILMVGVMAVKLWFFS